MRLGTHAGELERWLGRESVESVSEAMRSWYGRPIPLAGVPGDVHVYAGGDIRGRIKAGRFVGAVDVAEGIGRRIRRAARAMASDATVYSGFASLSAFIAAYSTPAQVRRFPFTKVGPSGTTSACHSLWQSAGSPAAGAAGSAAPGGRATDAATTGAFALRNAAGGQTMKFAAAYPAASVLGNTLLLYDRIYDVAKTMSSSTAESVTGVPSRYQSTTPGAEDSAEDNFLFIETQTALGATAHNWTVCQYTDQAGNTGHTLPAVTGISSCAAQRLDMPLMQWFAPLASGDTGIRALTQMQCSASVTGGINFVMGHPIAWMPCPVANQVCFVDGVTTAFARIFDDAALAFMEITKPSGTATSYAGQFIAVTS